MVEEHVEFFIGIVDTQLLNPLLLSHSLPYPPYHFHSIFQLTPQEHRANKQRKKNGKSYLFYLENIVVEEHVEFFIGIVDTQLFKAVESIAALTLTSLPSLPLSFHFSTKPPGASSKQTKKIWKILPVQSWKHSGWRTCGVFHLYSWYTAVQSCCAQSSRIQRYLGYLWILSDPCLKKYYLYLKS